MQIKLKSRSKPPTRRAAPLQMVGFNDGPAGSTRARAALSDISNNNQKARALQQVKVNRAPRGRHWPAARATARRLATPARGPAI